MRTAKKGGLRYRLPKRAQEESAPVLRFRAKHLKGFLKNIEGISRGFGVEEKSARDFALKVNRGLEHHAQGLRFNLPPENVFVVPLTLPDGKQVFFRVKIKKGAQQEPGNEVVSVKQVSAKHTVLDKWYQKRDLWAKRDPYENLLSILETGFLGKTPPNARLGKEYVELGSRSGLREKQGDRYIIKLLAPARTSIAYRGDVFIPRATRKQISGLIVDLDKGISKEQVLSRIKSYREELSRHKIPITFEQAGKRVAFRKNRKGNLELVE